MKADNTKRFSDRVENYLKYRPSYPKELASFLIEEARLDATSTVVDVGSGTGKLTRTLLEGEFAVIGVEPNREMREAGESLLADYGNFSSVDGTAEKTGLSDSCADLITAAQAYHWFDRERTRLEFERILKPGGKVALIWNERNKATPYLADYESFLFEYATEYENVNHRNVDEAELSRFFGLDGCELWQGSNSQSMDFEGVKGRYLSSSYSFTERHPDFVEAMGALETLFDKHSKEGKVRIEYDLNCYIGFIS